MTLVAFLPWLLALLMPPVFSSALFMTIHRVALLTAPTMVLWLEPVCIMPPAVGEKEELHVSDLNTSISQPIPGMQLSHAQARSPAGSNASCQTQLAHILDLRLASF